MEDDAEMQGVAATVAAHHHAAPGTNDSAEARVLYPVLDEDGGYDAQTYTPAVKVSDEETPEQAADRQRVDFTKLTFGAMRQNPVYALFVLTIAYLVYRIGVVSLYPIIRWMTFPYIRLMHNAIGKPFDFPVFQFVYAISAIFHFIFEDVIYPFVFILILDKVFVAILIIILFMFCIWLVWKYVMFFPIKEIVQAILKTTPPFSYFWDFFDRMEVFVFGTSSQQFKQLAETLAAGAGLLMGESLSQVNQSKGGTPTDPTESARTDGAPDDAPTAALRAATRACAAEYKPYDHIDPLSQIMVRNELTKCNLRGLNAFYSVTQPAVGDMMTACERAQGTPAIPAVEFADTGDFVGAVLADGNTTRYDDTGMRVIVALDGRTVATQVTPDGIMQVTDANGNTGFLTAARTRVVQNADGGFTPISDNLNQLLRAFREQPATADDPLLALMHREDGLIACQFTALKTTAANVGAELAGCDDGEEGVADPSLSASDPAGSLTNAKAFGAASADRQRRVGTCQNAKGTELAKLQQ